ncbi:hypothetical protein ACQ4PT_033598 [Festuca glaucescens]
MRAATYGYQALKEALAASISARLRIGPRSPGAASLPGSASVGRPKPLLYNAMLRGYLAQGLPQLAIELFQEMTCPPDHHTYHLAVTACARASEFELGRRIGIEAAAKGFASDLLVRTALVVMYSAAGDTEAARMLFDGIRHRDDVVWTALIAGYARTGRFGQALSLFERMRSADGVTPIESTLVSLVSGCASSGTTWKLHNMMHALAIRSGFHLSIFVCNALLEMYAEFGCLSEAVMLFRQMEVKDSITWSTMIGGLIRNGRRPDSALKVFRWMVSNSTVVNLA